MARRPKITELQRRMALPEGHAQHLTTTDFMRHERLGMRPSDLRYQKAMRMDRVRKWMSLALPHTQIMRLGLAKFATSLHHVKTLIKAVIEEFHAEAAEIETTPIHERRHADRLMLRAILQLAVKGNKLDTALRAMGVIIKLNGTMPVHHEDPAFVSDEAQGARGLPDELLEEVLASKRPIIAEVPQLVAESEAEPDPDGPASDDVEDAEIVEGDDES